MRSFVAVCVGGILTSNLVATARAEVTAAAPLETQSAESPAITSASDVEMPQQGFQWGVALGFGLPLGNADGGASLRSSEETGSQLFAERDGSLSGIAAYHVSLALDLGYRLSPQWWIGLRPEAATGGKGDQCPSGIGCHFVDFRAAALVKHHLAPHSSFDPWLGVALGWEWLAVRVSHRELSQVTVKQTLSGPILQALGGLAFDLGGQLHVGPFATVALGRYVWNGLECGEGVGCPDSNFVKDGAFHAWLGLGVSGEYGP